MWPPRRHPNWFSHSFWFLAAVGIGVGAAFALVQGARFGYELIVPAATKIPPISLGPIEPTQTSPLTSQNGVYFFSDPTKRLIPVSAVAYLAADLDSGEVIAEKNSQRILPIASLAKLMTALVSLEVLNPSELATVSFAAVATPGAAGSLLAGERLPSRELLYPLLLESSNDAAEVLARQAGREVFLKQLNDKATAIGLSTMRLVDPAGIAAENVASSHDLFRLAQYLYRFKPHILELSKQLDHQWNNHRWINNSHFLNNPAYLGGKSGHTTAADDTLVALFSLPLSEFSRRPVAIVLLGSNDRERDAQAILDYLKTNVYYAEPPAVNSSASTTLLFVGDIMLDRGVRQSVIKNGSGDWSWLFAKTPLLKTTAVTFANLEGPLSDQGSNIGSPYSFRMSPAVLPALKESGIDVLSVANNHIGDWGREAFVDTLDQLKVAGLVSVGGGRNAAEASTVKIIERHGIKIGFLAFSDVGPDWLAAGAGQSGILLAGNPRLEMIIKQAASEVDILVVSYHFGDEYQTEANERQKYLARLAIAAGAKIVVGHHPHVREPVERYENGVIAYSLGNFIFDQAFSKETLNGGVLSVTVTKKGISSFKEDISEQNEFLQPEIIKNSPN